MADDAGTLKRAWQVLRKKYDRLPKEDRENIVFILNYMLNSVPISVFVYLVMSLWIHHGVLRFLGTYICIIIFSIYFEHYYIWIRSKWKDNLS